MTTDIGIAGLAASLVLVVIAVGLSGWQRLGLERSMTGAVLRALVQLLVVGAALELVLDPGRPLLLSWLWVAAITVFAAATIGRRAPELPGVFPIALAANILTLGVALAVVYGLGIFPLEARTLVPVAGMTVGNAMKAGVVGAQRLVTEFADKRPEIEARLALGLSDRDASRPTMRSVLRTAITPQIETTRALGLVFIPGALTGLILAGVDPRDAVLVQLALVYLILGAVVTIVTVIVFGGARRLFTSDQRLVPLTRTADEH